MSELLIRFVVSHKNPGSGYREGFFKTAYRLVNTNVLSDADHMALYELMEWFNENLYIPERFNRSTSKGWSSRSTKGLSWFRASANDCISRAQQVRSILAKNGIDVKEVRTTNPGYITYSDPHQVVAEPFANTAGIR
jgi:hypothetical protein